MLNVCVVSFSLNILFYVSVWIESVTCVYCYSCKMLICLEMTEFNCLGSGLDGCYRLKK